MTPEQFTLLRFEYAFGYYTTGYKQGQKKPWPVSDVHRPLISFSETANQKNLVSNFNGKTRG